MRDGQAPGYYRTSMDCIYIYMLTCMSGAWGAAVPTNSRSDSATREWARIHRSRPPPERESAPRLAGTLSQGCRAAEYHWAESSREAGWPRTKPRTYCVLMI